MFNALTTAQTSKNVIFLSAVRSKRNDQRDVLTDGFFGAGSRKCGLILHPGLYDPVQILAHYGDRPTKSQWQPTAQLLCRFSVISHFSCKKSTKSAACRNYKSSLLNSRSEVL